MVILVFSSINEVVEYNNTWDTVGDVKKIVMIDEKP